MVEKWIKEGIVYHERLKPFKHVFSYKLFFLKFPVEQFGSLKNSVLSLNRFNLFSLHVSDYLDGKADSLENGVKKFLNDAGIEANGRIYLQTFPRILGYVFNPVSFWHIHNEKNELVYVLAEVNNTFGDRHFYLITVNGEQKLIANKEFHVSPFFDRTGKYHFVIEQDCMHVNYFDDSAGDYFFKSSLKQTAESDYSAAGLIKMFFRYPLMNFLVIFRIHWQALKLWLKKARFYTRPETLKPNITRTSV